jgi:hypothetical protein
MLAGDETAGGVQEKARGRTKQGRSVAKPRAFEAINRPRRKHSTAFAGVNSKNGPIGLAVNDAGITTHAVADCAVPRTFSMHS